MRTYHGNVTKLLWLVIETVILCLSIFKIIYISKTFFTKWLVKIIPTKSQAIIFSSNFSYLSTRYILMDILLVLNGKLNMWVFSWTAILLCAITSNLVFKTFTELNMTLLIFCIAMRLVWEIKCCYRGDRG